MVMQQCPLFTTVELQTFPNIYTSLSKVTAVHHFTQREWFYGTLSLATMKTSYGPRVKCMIFLFNFSQIWIFPTDLNKSSLNQISCTSIKWEPRWYIWKKRRMKGQKTGLTALSVTMQTHVKHISDTVHFVASLTVFLHS